MSKLLRKTLVLFGCLLFVTSAFAEDYYWTNNSRPGQRFSDPDSSCPRDIGSYFGTKLNYTGVSMNGATGTCMYEYYGSPYDGSNFVRGGSQCPAGTGPYVEATGQCPRPSEPEHEPGDKCDDQTGGTPSNPMIWDDTVNKCMRFTESEGDAPCTHIKSVSPSGTSYTVAGNLNAGGNAVAPPTFADGAIDCQVQTISSSECTLNVAGAISCNVIGALTGKKNPTGGAANAADSLCPESGCPVKEPKVETTEEKCAPTGTGSGGTSCTETKQTSSEGKQQCGTVNGAYQCITKKPTSNGVNTTITATSETLPDGGIKVTTVKDSSLTACTDVKTCTTSTSQTTQHSTTSPSGGTKTDTSCKGTCTAAGGGVETLPNAGTGTGGGTGNGNGDGEGEGSGGTASTSDTCAAPPPCDGDPFQCAILQQAHIDTCKLMAPADDATKAEWDAKIAQANADADAHQSTMDSQVNTLLSGFQSSTGGGGAGGGKCLPDVPVAVMGHTVTMEFSKTCDSISFIRMALLAMAYLVAARIVFKEV